MTAPRTSGYDPATGRVTVATAERNAAPTGRRSTGREPVRTARPHNAPHVMHRAEGTTPQPLAPRPPHQHTGFECGAL
jgi:hypothetical protein